LNSGAARPPSSKVLVAGAILVIAAVAAFGGVVYRDTLALVTETRRVERSHRAMSRLEVALSALKDAESGQRGYLLTGDPTYLQPYRDAAGAVAGHLDQLRQMTLESPEQQKRFVELQDLSRSKLDELAATIQLYARGDREAALRTVEAGLGNRTMRRIRDVVDAMRADEARLLAERARDADAAGREFRLAIVAGTAGLLLLLLGFILLVRRDVLGRERAQALARESEDRLRTTLQSIGDAVLATDAGGRVTFLNPVAERLTGFSQAEAAGRPVEEILRIENERTGAVIESPVRRVLRDGVVVGLANHTALIARDGTETPIADSAAPIRDPRGGLEGVVLVFRDIAEMRQAERSTQRLAAIIASASFALIAETPDNVITDWNDGAEAIFGFTAAEMIGRKFFDLAEPDSVDPAPALTAELAAGRRAGDFEGRRRTKDGRWLDVVVTLSAIRDEDGALIGVSRLVRDVTERRRHARELEEARLRAEEANAAKDRFLATLSHELRNPLTPIMASVHRLERRPDLPAGVAESISMIRRNVELEARLIDDLLDLTRIARGKVELDCAPLDVHELLLSVLQSSRSDFFSRGLHVTTALVAEEHHCHCDGARLQQVFLNLLRNAAKFTPSGGRVTLRSSNPQPGRLRVTVTDTGRGIRPDLLPRIFDAFDQGDVTAARRAGGLGLGLAIARNLVELHGGTLAASSEGEGRGASFAVEIATTAARPAGPEKPAPDEARLASRRRVRVLVVEDDADTGSALRQLLDEAGFDVRGADSVAAATRAFEERPADILMTDVGLPDGSGLDLLAALRPMHPALRAVVLSGYGMERDVERSRALGFAEHFAKPVNPSRLLAALDALEAEPALREPPSR